MNLNVRVEPIDRKGLSGEMRRPLYSALANTRAKSLGIVLPSWEQALYQYIETKKLEE
jgi:dTDP-4-dehydrorhamnose reductase